MALDFFAGSVGGVSGVIVGHPFDTVKIRLQTQPSSSYSGVIQCFTKIIREETVLGLYKGLLPPLFGFAAMNSLIFGVQGVTYRRLEPGRKSLFFSGMLGGLANALIFAPTDLVKTQLQIQGQGMAYKIHGRRRHQKALTFSGPVDCVTKLYKNGGLRLCYRGLLPTFLREGPSCGVYIALYHELCGLFTMPTSSVDQLGLMYLLLAGGLAGSASWIVTYPIDVVKSRFQADISGKYKTVLDCAKMTYQSGGIPIFFRGLSAAIVRGFPANAATLATVTLILRYARGNQDKVEIPG